MNIRAYWVCAIISIGFFTHGKAQTNYQVGTLPAINLNKKLDQKWELNLKMESRQLYDSFDWVLSDFALLSARKMGLNAKLALGYQARFRDNQVIHRSIQQFSIVQRLTGVRLAYRIATDQTFAASDFTEFRLRGRITTEIPLNGESVDPKEFYIKINHEYLNSWEGNNYDLEVRMIPLLGYVFQDNNKLELGMDARTSSFLDSSPRHNFWVAIAWYLKL